MKKLCQNQVFLTAIFLDFCQHKSIWAFVLDIANSVCVYYSKNKQKQNNWTNEKTFLSLILILSQKQMLTIRKPFSRPLLDNGDTNNEKPK